LVTTIGSSLLTNLTVNATPNLENAAALVLACFTVLILALSAGSLASALVTGGPQLGAGAFVGAAAATAAMGGAAYLGARYGVGRNPSPLQRYTAGVRAGEASGATGGNVGQRFMAGLRGAAFPSSVPLRPSGSSAPPATNTPPSPSSPPASGGGTVAARTAQAAQTASRAIQDSGRGSFGPTNMHDPES
jgi:type IV secretion system protein TrbL